MENVLTTYLNRRLSEEKSYSIKRNKPGPVITISREVGCNGLKLAEQVAQQLNKKNTTSEWKVLSKEVFHKSAVELDLDPEKVRQIFKRTDKYTFEEILDAFNNRKFKSERIIVKTVIDVIRSFAIDGFCIIVGRAGHIIARDIQNALHLRLFAPLDYRINTIMTNKNMSQPEAVQFIRQVEKERVAFRKAIRDERKDDDFFDLYVNRASFGDKETVDIIENAVDKKQMLKDYRIQMQYY